MFQGSIVALVTPMDEAGELDLEALRSLISWHLEQGSDALVVAGTTGEGATLTDDEFGQLVAAAVEQVAGRVPVVAGTGCVDTARVIHLTRMASAAGAEAALVVTPYYVRPMQSGLEAHYRAVAEASDIPLVLYNVPSRTAVDLLPDTVARLAGHENIVAIKEASGDMQRIDELLERCGHRMTVLSGDDPSCLQAMTRGARGVVSVAANVVPARFHAMCADALGGQAARAAEVNAELGALYRILAVESNPIPVKWAVSEMGRIGPAIRLPLLPFAETHRKVARDCLRELGVLGAP